ncbi:hypothetical protein [Kitasatospora sp. P5_F3]
MEPQAEQLRDGGDEVVPAERSSERLMPAQEAAEPLLSRAEQSAEPMMPRQMQAMAAEDPFGTVTEARSSVAAAPDGTVPAMQMTERTSRQVDSKQAQSASSPSGSAGAGFVAIPEQYRAAAGPVLGVADDLKETYTSLSGYLSGMHGNSPWGNDDDGKKYADGEDGEPGYLGNAKDILEGLKLLPEIVEVIGKRLKGMADSYESSEQFGLDTMGKPELPLPGTGQPDLVLRDIANGKLNGRH